MISYSELKKGERILLNNQPYEIVESAPMFKGRGQSVLQAKIRNLITGEIRSHTFRPSDNFDVPDISNKTLKFIYSSKQDYFFHEENNLSNRFKISGQKLGTEKDFLKQGQEIEGLFFENKFVAISMPIKVVLKVETAPPAFKGQRAQPGTKRVVLETGATINTPIFIEIGDVVEINTQTREYVRRIT